MDQRLVLDSRGEYVIVPIEPIGRPDRPMGATFVPEWVRRAQEQRLPSRVIGGSSRQDAGK